MAKARADRFVVGYIRRGGRIVGQPVLIGMARAIVPITISAARKDLAGRDKNQVEIYELVPVKVSSKKKRKVK